MGIHWRTEKNPAIDYLDGEEAGIARASVLVENGLYRMWFSYRKAKGYRTCRDQAYRVGYAESSDGKRWRRMDPLAGIDVSNEGWDSQMVEYAHVVQLGSRKLMFYNGNGFGSSGVGYAVADEG